MCHFLALRKKIPPILLLTTPLLSLSPQSNAAFQPAPAAIVPVPTHRLASRVLAARMPFYGTLDEGFLKNFSGLLFYRRAMRKRLENGQKNDRETEERLCRREPRRPAKPKRRYHAVHLYFSPAIAARLLGYLRSRPVDFRRIWRVHTLQLRSSCVSFFTRTVKKALGRKRSTPQRKRWRGRHPARKIPLFVIGPGILAPVAVHLSSEASHAHGNLFRVVTLARIHSHHKGQPTKSAWSFPRQIAHAEWSEHRRIGSGFRFDFRLGGRSRVRVLGISFGLP